jgi:hypothetical protein
VVLIPRLSSNGTCNDSGIIRCHYFLCNREHLPLIAVPIVVFHRDNELSDIEQTIPHKIERYRERRWATWNCVKWECVRKKSTSTRRPSTDRFP